MTATSEKRQSGPFKPAPSPAFVFHKFSDRLVSEKWISHSLRWEERTMNVMNGFAGFD